jgi:hypothetical protein
MPLGFITCRFPGRGNPHSTLCMARSQFLLKNMPQLPLNQQLESVLLPHSTARD